MWIVELALEVLAGWLPERWRRRIWLAAAALALAGVFAAWALR